MSHEQLQKSIVVCSNYAWTIFNFRLGLIRRLKSRGYRVVVLTQFDGFEKEIASEVDEMEPLFISRKGINPFVDLLTILDISRCLIRHRAHILLSFTIKPVIYGSIAARMTNVCSVAMITGLGTAFIATNWLTLIVRKLYAFALSSASAVFFQNNDDKELFVENNLVNPLICEITPGSGLDIKKYPYMSYSTSGELAVLLVARLLWDKGIKEFVDAARALKSRFPEVEFQLLGPMGVENRTSIPERAIQKWVREGTIRYLGETTDVKPFIEKACCVVLPSYREGTSRVLLEAAAIGRPLIATNVAGCKEIIVDGVTGYLCEPRNYSSLAGKIEQMLLMEPDERRIMGVKGRAKVELEYDQEIVFESYINMIERL